MSDDVKSADRFVLQRWEEEGGRVMSGNDSPILLPYRPWTTPAPEPPAKPPKKPPHTPGRLRALRQWHQGLDEGKRPWDPLSPEERKKIGRMIEEEMPPGPGRYWRAMLAKEMTLLA